MFRSSTTTSDYSNPIPMGVNIMRPLVMERGGGKWKYSGGAEIAPSCPRCASANTKFCYYNNYSLSQPRYFCKACRRYWTKGGSLRNVPVGGGCRKSRRARAASRHPSSAAPSYADQPSAAAAAFIDMAAVFAKYVNHNSNDDDSLSPGSSSENAPASALEEVYQTPIADDQMQQVTPQMSTCQDVTGQQLLYQDYGNAFELQQQGVLYEDILWAEGTTLQNFAYPQPMVQVDDCGLFAPDHDEDQLRISANMVSDNWGSFDLSAYDFYSTP